MALFVILSSLLGAQGNKFYSLPSEANGCSLPVNDDWCTKLVAMWGCDTPWNVQCPQQDHPMGASYNEATLQQTCLAVCQHAAAEPVAEPAAEPGTEPPKETNEPGVEPPIEPEVLQQAQFTEKLMAAIRQRADEAEAAGNVEKARNLRMVADKEAYIQLQKAGVPNDSQQVLAAEMAARQAAEDGARLCLFS